MEEDIESMTVGAVQRNWKVRSAFPCTPEGGNGIREYLENLSEGKRFSSNDRYWSTVMKYGEGVDGGIVVMTEFSSGIKPYGLAKVTYEKGIYVHESLGTYFSEEGIEKGFTIELGLEWVGGDTIDDLL